MMIINKYQEKCGNCCAVKLQQILIEIGELMTSVSELSVKLDAISAQLGKASMEIQAEVQTLKDQLANVGQLTPEAEASLANLMTVAQALDDLNPDAV